LGMTSGRFLSFISSTTHPTRLPQPSWIWFPLFIWRTPVDWSVSLVPQWGPQSSPCSTSPQILSSIHSQTTSHSCSQSATARFPRRFSDKSRGLFTSLT
jgi:hypothetical protein